MNEDDIVEEDATSDRTLVPENEEEKQEELEENPSPEYRMATITPTVANTIPMATDEIHEDEEATLADPTIMTLQTPLPEQQHLLKHQQQQNMQRLMDKIEKQRKAAQNRSSQQPTTFVTPTNKTPKKLLVSPGYIESETSIDSSISQQKEQDEQSSSNTTTAEIEERRIQLEFVFSFPIKSIFSFKSIFSIDLENKHLKKKFVYYLKELIFYHKLQRVKFFHHHLIFQLKVYLKIYVQQIILEVFHQHHHLFTLIDNNKKMIINNLHKLFKL